MKQCPPCHGDCNQGRTCNSNQDICEQEFHKTFPDVFSPNDVAIRVWRLAWQAGRKQAFDETRELFERHTK